MSGPEANFQRHVIRRLKETFEGCVVLKNDPNYLQGIPDLLVLHGPKWVAIEVKRSKDAPFRPNQVYYLEYLSAMGQAYVIYPENEDEIFDEIQRSL